MSRRIFGLQLSSTGGCFWGPCWPCGLVGLVGHPAGGGTISSGCWHCDCQPPGMFSHAAGVSHCFRNVARWIGSAFLTASVIDSRHDTKNWNTVPGAKAQCNRVFPKEGASIVNDCPGNPGTDFFCVCIPNCETLFPVEDPMDYNKLPIIVTLFSKKQPQEGAKRAYVEFKLHVIRGWRVDLALLVFEEVLKASCCLGFLCCFFVSPLIFCLDGH
jgi:hypothetical protein